MRLPELLSSTFIISHYSHPKNIPFEINQGPLILAEISYTTIAIRTVLSNAIQDFTPVAPFTNMV